MAFAFVFGVTPEVGRELGGTEGREMRQNKGNLESMRRIWSP